jgi:hypothetical protein
VTEQVVELLELKFSINKIAIGDEARHIGQLPH